MCPDRLPVLFVGSSSEAAVYAGALQKNLKQTAKVVPWNRINFALSRSTLDTLEKKLEESDFAAFVFAPDDSSEIRGEHLNTVRDNVLIELGLFMGRLGRDRTFIVFPTGCQDKLRIPSDLLGLTSATYPRDEYDAKSGNATEVMSSASSDIETAILRLGCRRSTSAGMERRVEGVLERGDSSEILTLADAGIHVGDDRHDYPRQLKHRIRSGELLQMKYLYWTPQGSAHWLEVCTRRSYFFYCQSLELLKREASSIVSTIIQALGTAEVDFVSIGSGDGEKDNILLRSFDKKLADNAFVYYYPIDISDALIVKAVPTALGRGVRRSHFRVKALIADFVQLPNLQKFYEERSNRNVFAVLGNSLGNADESELFQALAEAMLDGDIVILEVNTSKANDKDPLLKEPSNMEHDFTPLASLNVPFDQNKLSYSLVEGISIVRGTQSILAKYADAVIDEQTVSNIRLSIVHHYVTAEFQNAMEEQLNVKTLKLLESDGVALFIAQRQ